MIRLCQVVVAVMIVVIAYTEVAIALQRSSDAVQVETEATIKLDQTEAIVYLDAIYTPRLGPSDLVGDDFACQSLDDQTIVEPSSEVRFLRGYDFYEAITYVRAARGTGLIRCDARSGGDEPIRLWVSSPARVLLPVSSSLTLLASIPLLICSTILVRRRLKARHQPLRD